MLIVELCCPKGRLGMSELHTLLLTDVVDSTRLSAQLGDQAMAALWAAHDRVARDLLPIWQGREIDKSDGMLLLFPGVEQALQYALAYQRALGALSVPLQARAGVHHGPAVLRENSAADIALGAKPLEVEGLSKALTARVMSLAGGGQVLLTHEACAALGSGPPAGLALHHRGHWVMKGVDVPVEVFEVAQADGLPGDVPDSDKAYRVVRSGERWLPAREIPNNLPQGVTSFIGREREIAELRAKLLQARLVTLLGMGGIGKTRLALQVAEESKHLAPDGVWFVDLSTLRDPTLVIAETAKAVGLREEPDRPLLQSLVALLKPRKVLLVLDNCEHLLDAAGDLVDALLRAVPQLRILASSREPLDVPGEQSYPVQPLPVPGRGQDVPTLLQSTAVRLFVERAQGHQPDFDLADEPDAVVDLVARLEGIPLAIELAAARLRQLGIAEINAALADRYQTLTGGSRRVQARQQTLRALVDWSYELLNPQEKLALQRLALFVGGFELDTAEPVCNFADLQADQLLDMVGSLTDKSLLLAAPSPRGARWRMLQTIRDYALEKLEQSGDLAQASALHAERHFALAKQARDGLKGPAPSGWVDRVETELDNLRAAGALALAGGVDPFIAVKLAVALQRFWILRGYASEGRGLVQAALALPAVQASPHAQAHALYVGCRAGHQPERPCRGASHADDLPGPASPTGQPRGHCSHLVHLVARAAAQR